MQALRINVLLAAIALAAPIARESLHIELPFDFVLEHAPTPEKHQIETMPGGVALIDFDADGRLDVFFANGAAQPSLDKSPRHANRLYRNLGNGRWRDATAETGVAGEGYSMAAAAADFDNDGATDLFVAGVNRNLLYRNNHGRFIDITRSAGIAPNPGWTIGAGWFDYDRDGDLDLFAVRYVVFDRSKEPYCGDPARNARAYCHPKFYEPLANILYRNNADGTFTDVSAASGIAAHKGKGMAVAFGDFDSDGWLDPFVTNDTEPNFLFHNNRNGTFSEIAMDSGAGLNDDGRALSSMGVDVRDMDNDGHDDIFITALFNESFPLFRNTGRGRFLDVTYAARVGGPALPYSGWGAAAVDLDNDGRKDLIAAAGDVNNNTEQFASRASKQPLLIWWNRGKTYQLETFGVPARYRGAAFGDLDNDGAIDMVITALGERPRVVWNRATGANHWIGFDAPLGALIRIQTENGEQWNRAAASYSYASSNDARVHFGLGASTRVIEADITLLSGDVRKLGPQTSGRYIKVAAGGPSR